MKIVPISTHNSSFRGYTKYLNLGMYSRYSLSDTPSMYAGQWEGEHGGDINAVLESSMRPNSTIEKTLGNFHSKRLFNVYFADPLEYIDDEMRKKYDYIIYDNEPKYPNPDEISKTYFFEGYKDYQKDFEEIRDYYYRLEMADRKTLSALESNNAGKLSVAELNEKIAYYKDRITKSQYQQWQAQECLNKYNSAKDLINKKDRVASDINGMEFMLKNNEMFIYDCKKDIEEVTAEKKGCLKEQKLFDSKLKNYEQIIKNNEVLTQLYEKKNERFFDKSNSETENNFAKKQIKRLNDIVNNLQKNIDSTNETLEKLKEKLADYLTHPKIYPGKIAAKKNELVDIKAKLIPLFDDLKLFYAARKILG